MEKIPNSRDWIDATRKRLRLKNQSDVARSLKISRSAVSQYINGDHSLSVGIAIQIAQILEVPEMAIICSTMAEQSFRKKNIKEFEFWRENYMKFSVVIKSENVDNACDKKENKNRI